MSSVADTNNNVAYRCFLTGRQSQACEIQRVNERYNNGDYYIMARKPVLFTVDTVFGEVEVNRLPSPPTTLSTMISDLYDLGVYIDYYTDPVRRSDDSVAVFDRKAFYGALELDYDVSMGIWIELRDALRVYRYNRNRE